VTPQAYLANAVARVTCQGTRMGRRCLRADQPAGARILASPSAGGRHVLVSLAVGQPARHKLPGKTGSTKLPLHCLEATGTAG
jgi:hypothetical protein